MTLRSFLKTNCKPFYCVWNGKRKDTWKRTRYISSVLAGTICAWVMCKCMIKSLLISKRYENLFLLISILIIATGFLLTDAIKCISLMIFVCLFGKSGRSYMRALSFSLVIAGSIENLSSNTGEIIRSFSCSKILAINLTRSRYDLMIKPFQKALVHMGEDVRNVQITFKKLHNVAKELHEEIMFENQDENSNASIPFKAATSKTVNTNLLAYKELNVEYVDSLYKSKIKKRCHRQLENGKLRCRKAFSNALKKCYNKIPFFLKTLICWPFKGDFMCKINVFGNPDEICDSADAIPENFSKTYVELVGTESELSENGSNIKVHYTILSSKAMPVVKLPEEYARNVAEEFKIRKHIFHSVLKVLQQFLGFMVLKILYGMYKK